MYSICVTAIPVLKFKTPKNTYEILCCFKFYRVILKVCKSIKHKNTDNTKLDFFSEVPNYKEVIVQILPFSCSYLTFMRL